MKRLRWVLKGPGRTRRGVTLLEVVLAIGMLGFVSAMTFWFYSSALETSHRGTDEAHRLRMAHVVLDRFSREIRQAAAATVDYRVGILGEEENIWLSSYRVVSREQVERRVSGEEDPPAAEYDVTKVEYRIARHPEIKHEEGWAFPLGLVRVEVMVPRPLAPLSAGTEERESAQEQQRVADRGEESDTDPSVDGEDAESDEGAELGAEVQWSELYAPEIRFLRFCYHDGRRWWDRWEVTGETPLPQLVMVTIGFEPRPSLHDPAIEEDRINEEFCECLNEDPVTCEPLEADQYSTVVRIPQADPLFRSRVTRESQAFLETLGREEEEEEVEP